MALAANRIATDFVIRDMEKHLLGREGRKILLIDQHIETPPEIEVIDVRNSSPSALATPRPNHVLYAVDQDDIGLPFILWLIEHHIPFFSADSLLTARYSHINQIARRVIDAEFVRQTEEGFAKFDNDDSSPGFADFENICQALEMTRQVPGAYVEIGCFEGSSSCIALRYMSETGIYRPSYFLDVFDGFTYEHAKASLDAVWTGTHIVAGGRDVVAGRLQRFEQRNLGRPVHVLKSNIITDPVPPEIDQIAVANIDVDQLEAVYASLVKLAPKVALGGILIVEDPGHTPQLIGALAALEIFTRSADFKGFIKLYMRSGQYFLIRIAR